MAPQADDSILDTSMQMPAEFMNKLPSALALNQIVKAAATDVQIAQQAPEIVHHHRSASSVDLNSSASPSKKMYRTLGIAQDPVNKEDTEKVMNKDNLEYGFPRFVVQKRSGSKSRVSGLDSSMSEDMQDDSLNLK